MAELTKDAITVRPYVGDESRVTVEINGLHFWVPREFCDLALRGLDDAEGAERVRELVNKRELSRDLTELMAKQLHYLEHIHGKSDFKTAAETSEAIEGGLRRYATDYIFRSKITSTVASILDIIDAAIDAARKEATK